MMEVNNQAGIFSNVGLRDSATHGRVSIQGKSTSEEQGKEDYHLKVHKKIGL